MKTIINMWNSITEMTRNNDVVAKINGEDSEKSFMNLGCL